MLILNIKSKTQIQGTLFLKNRESRKIKSVMALNHKVYFLYMGEWYEFDGDNVNQLISILNKNRIFNRFR